MKKNVFSLLLVCCFAFIGIAQAQEEINVNVTTDFNVTISQTRTPIALTYAPDPVEPAGILGVGGMPLYWGYMFPAAMVEPYAGKYITHVAYIDAGETQFAGTYEVNIYLGGDKGLLAQLRKAGYKVKPVNRK